MNDLEASRYQTSASLLSRLKQPNDKEAWDRFVGIYTGLLHHWARALGLQDSDAEDLVQQVLMILLRELPRFQYDNNRHFRGWLWTVLVNQQKKNWRKRQPAGDIGDPQDDFTDPLEEREYRTYVTRRALELMKSSFEEKTWRACWENVVEGKSTEEVARGLGMKPASVRQAKCRVLKELREQLSAFFE